MDWTKRLTCGPSSPYVEPRRHAKDYLYKDDFGCLWGQALAVGRFLLSVAELSVVIHECAWQGGARPPAEPELTPGLSRHVRRSS